MIAVIVELRDLHERCSVKPGRIDVSIGDKVLISTANGLETAVVVELEKMINEKEIEMKIIRPLNDDDYRVLEEKKEYERKVLPDIIKAIKEENLAMKLTRITYTYDRQKLFIY